jgi:D-arabinonate dehydratase/D-galactarolactone cycloisomerase
VCTPHISIGSAIHIAASAHVAAATPNFNIMEFWTGNNPLSAPILKQPLNVTQGILRVPEGPGLGIEIDEDALLRHASG